MRSTHARVGVVALLATATATAGNAAPSSAAPAPVTAGRTDVTLTAATYRSLKRAGVRVRGGRPTTVRRGRVVRLSRPAGRFDAATDRGSVRHRGSIVVARGKRRATLRSLRLALGRRWMITATLGGRRIGVLTLDRRRARVRQSGATRVISGVPARLTRPAAKRLNRALRKRVFRAGRRVASVRIVVRSAGGANAPAPAPPAAGTAPSQLSFASGRLAGLVAPLSPAAANADGTISLPVGAAAIDPQALKGTVDLTGGLRLGGGSLSTVDLQQPRLVLGTDAQGLYATVNGAQLKAADVDLSQAAKVTLADGSVRLDGLQLRVAPGLASLLGPGILPGDLLGTLSVPLPAAA